jgi:type IV pilus biogenesis protein CpaD/CtpE
MRTLLAASLLTTLLAGCAEHSILPHAGFGEAVQRNMAAQIIDPAPADRTLGAAPGVRRSIMLGRYQTDTVEPPLEILTIDE